MAEKYFIKFPRIEYGGMQAVNITARPQLLNSVRGNPFLFYPYEIKEGERPDQLAERYYSDPYMAWLVYLSNQIIDPYYDWNMSYSEFSAFIRKKYGSIETAQETIKFYRNNWADAEEITPERFAALSVEELKYWNEVTGVGGAIIAYERKKIDWVLNTNRTVHYKLSAATTLTVGERVTITYESGAKAGSGTVISQSDSTHVDVYHVAGYYYPVDADTAATGITGATITGVSSAATAGITEYSVLGASLTGAEEVYWTPVYAYEWEEEKNSKNRSIKLLDSKFGQQTAQELKALL